MSEDRRGEIHDRRLDDATEASVLDQSRWRSLTEARDPSEFGEAWIVLQAHLIGNVTAGLLVARAEPGDALVPLAAIPGPAAAAALGGALERVLEQKQGVAVRASSPGHGSPADSDATILAYPVWVGSDLRGACAVQIAPRPRGEVLLAMRQLQWGVAWVQNWFLRRVAAPEAGRTPLDEVLDLAALTLEQRGFKDAATAFATETAARLRCDRVSLGFPKGHHVRVRAISHSAEFSEKMNLFRSIGLAMDESVDQGATIVLPEIEARASKVGASAARLAHEQLMRDQGVRAVCTVPFVGPEGRLIGAMTLERVADEPFAQDDVDLCQAVAALVGPILDEKRRQDRWLIAKIGDAIAAPLRLVFGQGHVAAKLVATGVAAAAIFLTFATGEYRIKAETALEGKVQRAVVAPFRGFLRDAPARAGEVVRAGQALCTLDDRDLQLERTRWLSERERGVLEHRKAMAEGDVAAMNMLGKKIRQAEAQLDLLDEQLSRTHLRAPFDGVIVSGDLSQRLSAPVEAGEVLFTIAPLDEFRLTLRIDERDIEEVAAGQSGDMVLTALPSQKLRFRVTRITPVSISEEGKNYFEAEADLERPPSEIRPGMEGVAKIEKGRRKLVWIWTHELIDWLRLRAWTWLP